MSYFISLEILKSLEKYPYFVNSKLLGVDKVEISFYAKEENSLLLQNHFEFVIYDEKNKGISCSIYS
jgi:hypothetical protein